MLPLEVTKYTRMYYRLEHIGLLGPAIEGNEIMYRFLFRDLRIATIS